MEGSLKIRFELDELVRESQGASLPPDRLIELQTKISAVKYTLSAHMTVAEQKMLLAKDAYETHLIKQKLMLQATDPKLSTAKAADMVENEDDAIALRMNVIDTKVEYSALKNRIDAAKDVLVALSMRIKGLEQEAREGKFHT